MNDLDILMEFRTRDLGLLVNECNMKQIHANYLLKKIENLRKSNFEFQQWLESIGMRKKYYKHMMSAGAVCRYMLIGRFADFGEFFFFIGEITDMEMSADECWSDSITIWSSLEVNDGERSNKRKYESFSDPGLQLHPKIKRFKSQ